MELGRVSVTRLYGDTSRGPGPVAAALSISLLLKGIVVHAGLTRCLSLLRVENFVNVALLLSLWKE